MYRGSSSPIFDASEFPPLRRVKPLPKRRRSTCGGDPQLLAHSENDHAAAQFVPPIMMPPALDRWVKPPSAQDDDTDADLGQQQQQEPPSFQSDHHHHDDRPSEYPGGFAIPVGPVDDDDNGDGDYVDHLQQPGNTKKRKVPAAAHSTADLTSSSVEEAEGGRGATHADKETSETASSALPPSAPSLLATKRHRYSPATLAGLQHKELLKTRKMQLAAVLGALSHGDTLALEQALSARYSSLASSVVGKENIPYDRIRKKPVRRKPASWAHLRSPEKNAVVLRSGEFTFSFPSPTSERLISTREEVAILHARFEAELARQGAKAAEVARQNALAAGGGGGGQPRERKARTSTTDTTAAKASHSKKKKRSTLANASNPHHLRNYVPSRLPHSGAPTVGQGATALNLVSALPVRFLTAEIPRRRLKKKKTKTTTTTTTGPPSLPLMQPEDEWICPLCEYSLFYGEETAFRRAIRNRKKILIRRRRARERAAAAASGQKPGVAPMDKTTTETTPEEATGTGAVVGNTVGRPGATRKERDKAGM